MSKEFLDNPYSILGLVAGIIVCIIVYLVNRHIGKKKRLFDERYHLNANQAKARSWDAMIIIYLIAWFLVITFDGISFSFFLITTLYLCHNLTLIVTSIYVTKRQ